MKKQTTTFLMTFLCAAGAAVGCSSSPATSNDGGTGGTGAGGNSFTAVPLVPDGDGFVALDTTGGTGIQGAWYAYGDGLGSNAMPPGDCQNAGHSNEECSKIELPVTPGPFTNTGGKMCTRGTVAKVIGMTAMPTMPDYAKIWGAGIGLDVNNPGGAAGKSALDASGLAGIEFDLDMKPLAGLRVEVEATDTNGTEAGNDYWGATSGYPPSPVVVGTNTVTWDKFVGPKGHVFNPTMLRGIQFHVPASTSGAGAYEFCISNMKVLKK